MTLEVIEGWIAHRESRCVCVTSVHGVMESWRNKTNPDIASILRVSLRGEQIPA